MKKKGIIIGLFLIMLLLVVFKDDASLKQVFGGIGGHIDNQGKTKVVLEYVDETNQLNIQNIDIDENTLPEEFKDYQFYDVIPMNEMDSVKAFIRAYLKGELHDEGYMLSYTKREQKCSMSVCKKSIILLYSKERDIMGYAEYPESPEGEIYVEFHKYVVE